jgi:Fe-S cluster assembly ATP-binding protein
MAVLDPCLSILDETDSGLDIDAMKIVAQGVNRLFTPEKALLMITHYQRLLDYIPLISSILWSRVRLYERRS